MNKLLGVVTLCAALGSGLVGGVLFAFSTFVMGALARLPPSQGLAAMQSINVVVINRWFLGPFLATGAVLSVLAVVSLARWSEPGAGLVVLGAALYVIGTLGLTATYHVPHNERLALLRPESAEAIAAWLRYVPAWTAWNHVRAATAFLAAAALTLSLIRRAEHGQRARITSSPSCEEPAMPRPQRMALGVSPKPCNLV